ncbi:flagellar biosynthesis anti-sigma factor FlgM [Altererythrobacter sp. KTW20L]|uniref:flagellar biosynthesis anti-sigma factor FlgM n=1 Tax=Altererythrobacter sp. KTW20L TaxID=2942210 RepID=UPI0020BE93B2|nr:flagellar biosynthesis anti-sigma factor FlgM [Altererythrobacter sp. KTW20L]MCL6251673.1 flagellar biosynthesis anti-sigma factor FlgM [Altererythrobacter sp. KTW20L]
MSLYDISRLSGPAAMRPVARDMPEARTGAKPEAKSAQSAPAADGGIAVETGARVATGPVPVQQDRVAEIRDALKNGSYPIVPAQITDAVIAARLMLSGSQ